MITSKGLPHEYVNPPYTPYVWNCTTSGELFICTDNTRNANVWVGQGGALVGDYPFPYALSFDGVDDYVSLGNDTSSHVDPPFTIEARVKHDGNLDASQQPIFCGNESVYGHTKNYISLDSDGYISLDQWTPGGGKLLSNIPLQADMWYHIAATQTSSDRKIYINGEVDVSDTNPEIYIGNTPEIWLIGGRVYPSNVGQFFPGLIDEVRYWSVERTQQQIQDNMNTTLTGTETGLVAYYKFNEGSGTTLTDSAGTNDGTINGATWLQATGFVTGIGYEPIT